MSTQYSILGFFLRDNWLEFLKSTWSIVSPSSLLSTLMKPCNESRTKRVFRDVKRSKTEEITSHSILEIISYIRGHILKGCYHSSGDAWSFPSASLLDCLQGSEVVENHVPDVVVGGVGGAIEVGFCEGCDVVDSGRLRDGVKADDGGR